MHMPNTDNIGKLMNKYNGGAFLFAQIAEGYMFIAVLLVLLYLV